MAAAVIPGSRCPRDERLDAPAQLGGPRRGYLPTAALRPRGRNVSQSVILGGPDCVDP